MPIEKNYCECPKCGHRHIADNREISLFKGMSRALFRVYKWCKENGRHEFQRKDIKHLFGGESVSARFGDWVWFGGLVYKGKKAHYGLNMERCHDFFSGQRQIPIRIEKDSVKNEIVRVLEYQNAKDIPELYQLLTEDGEYQANYIKRKCRICGKEMPKEIKAIEAGRSDEFCIGCGQPKTIQNKLI